MPKVSAIIPAAGSGKRMGGGSPKQYLQLGGRPVIIRTLALFQQSPLIDEIILVSPWKEVDFTRQLVDEAGLTKVSRIVEGGIERQDSIRNGLNCLDQSTEIVVIHDGVRPLIRDVDLEATIVAAREFGAALLAVPVKDTVKEVNKDGLVARTVPRRNLWLAQTPQVFSYELIKEAYRLAEKMGIAGTDDSFLVEHMGREVRIVAGSYENIKITTREDLIFAENLLKERC